VNKAGLLYKDDFRIVIRIDESYTRPLAITPTDFIRREVMGSQLLDPRHGDVIFRFPEAQVQQNMEEKTLFASSDLLCRFSAYFKQLLHGDFRESSPESLEFHVKYDTDPATNLPALRALLSGNRKVIPVHNARFTDYHNILYYIYTGSLNLRYPKDARPPTPLTTWETTPAFPRPANPNEIYRLAGIMGLGELQGRAYHYLSSTCSVDNIFDRLFDPYCKAPTHAPVRGVYQQFLARNWETVRAQGQWHALLRRYRSTQREDEADHLLDTMVSILNSVTWDPKAAASYTASKSLTGKSLTQASQSSSSVVKSSSNLAMAQSNMSQTSMAQSVSSSSVSTSSVSIVRK